MATQANSKKKASKVSSFFKGIKAELKKISWPTSKELVNHTTVVIVACLLVAGLVGLLDVVFINLIKLITP